jgi:hypothetical protein
MAPTFRSDHDDPRDGDMAAAAGLPLTPATRNLGAPRAGIGWIARVLLTHWGRRAARQAAADAAQQFAAERKQLRQLRIMHDRTEAGRRRLIDRFQRGAALDHEVQNLSAAFCAAVFERAEMMVTHIAEQEQERLTNLRARHQTGELTEAAYRRHCAAATAASDAQVAQVRDRARQLITNHTNKLTCHHQPIRDALLNEGDDH